MTEPQPLSPYERYRLQVARAHLEFSKAIRLADEELAASLTKPERVRPKGARVPLTERHKKAKAGAGWQVARETR